MTSTLQQAARAFADAFERRTRDNGDSFTSLKDGAPDWMDDIVYSAHDGMMPDDWKYRLIEAMADRIADRLDYDPDADICDIIAESADNAVPDDTRERLDWLASHPDRANMLDETVDEYGWTSGGLFEALGAAIYRELESIGHHIATALEAQAGED